MVSCNFVNHSEDVILDQVPSVDVAIEQVETSQKHQRVDGEDKVFGDDQEHLDQVENGPWFLQLDDVLYTLLDIVCLDEATSLLFGDDAHLEMWFLKTQGGE